MNSLRKISIENLRNSENENTLRCVYSSLILLTKCLIIMKVGIVVAITLNKQSKPGISKLRAPTIALFSLPIYLYPHL